MSPSYLLCPRCLDCCQRNIYIFFSFRRKWPAELALLCCAIHSWKSCSYKSVQSWLHCVVESLDCSGEMKKTQKTPMAHAEIVSKTRSWSNITSCLSSQSAAMTVLTCPPQVSKLCLTASGGSASIHGHLFNDKARRGDAESLPHKNDLLLFWDILSWESHIPSPTHWTA